LALKPWEVRDLILTVSMRSGNVSIQRRFRGFLCALSKSKRLSRDQVSHCGQMVPWF
jgi:hypothetical protein